MDEKTMKFIAQENEKIYDAIDRFKDSMDVKLTGLQKTFAEQNLMIGQGIEKFKGINTRFEDNKTWHSLLLSLAILTLGGLAGLVYKLL